MKLIVGIEDGEGKIILKQSYREYIEGKRKIELVSYTSGKKLFDILVDELGYIRYEDNKFALKYVIENNVNRAVMRLLGKIAEAIIVRDCRDDAAINCRWFSIARKKSARKSTASKYIALGTGLLNTKRNFSKNYNPSDPQRDIVWWNEEEKLTAIISKNKVTGAVIAGLQIKVSMDGMLYVYPDIAKKRYEVPLIYFGLNGDFDKVAQKLYKEKRDIVIGTDFINAKTVNLEEYEELMDYKILVHGLVTGQITPDDLVNDMGQKDKILKTAILSSRECKIKCVSYR